MVLRRGGGGCRLSGRDSAATGRCSKFGQAERRESDARGQRQAPEDSRQTTASMPFLEPLHRRVEPEWLDELPADDPRAVRSRRDLRLVNRIMGHASIIARALASCATSGSPRIAEIGAGDGTLMLR